MPLEKMICDVNYTTDLILDNVNGLIDSGIAIESTPDGFYWPEDLPEVTAMKVGDKFSCNLRPEDLIDFSVFTNKLYVDINMPDSSGDGLAWSTAEKSISAAIDTAIASGVATRILVKGGVYPRAYSICGTGGDKVLTAPITIESSYGDVLTGTFDDLSYTKTLTQDYVYEAARSGVLVVFNPSSTSNRKENTLYTQVDSLVDCNSQSGSFYTDGTTLYVHTFNSTPANNKNTLACLSSRGAVLTGNQDIYMSGINMAGGNTGALHIEDGSTNIVVANNCEFNFSFGGGGGGTPKDGVEVLGCKLFAGFNCDASNGSKDGFNLHIQDEVTPSMLLVNSTAYDNGYIDSTSLSNNGVTVHDGLSAIVIGGEYLGSIGTNVGHVGDDTNVWCFGVTAGQSEGDVYNGGSIYYGAFGIWDGNGKMWLDYCTDFSSSVGIRAGGDAEVFVTNHTGTGIYDGNTAPQLLSQPTVSGSTAPTEEAEVSNGTWDSTTPTEFTYQWQLNGVDIPTATSSALLLLVGWVGSTVRCVITCTNAYGSSFAYSTSITVTL